jgi:predicted outer membrane lipoprotein
MNDFLAFLQKYSWIIGTLLAFGVLFGIFLKRRDLAKRATRAGRGDDPDEQVTPTQFARARLQFLMTLFLLVLLIVIWRLQS